MEYEQRFIEQKRPEKGTSAFIQWKGTDVCADLLCECGWYGHHDGYFLYTWECPDCGTVWEAPDYISYRKSQRLPPHTFITAKMLRDQE